MSLHSTTGAIAFEFQLKKVGLGPQKPTQTPTLQNPSPTQSKAFAHLTQSGASEAREWSLVVKLNPYIKGIFSHATHQGLKCEAFWVDESQNALISLFFFFLSIKHSLLAPSGEFYGLHHSDGGSHC